MLAGAVVFTLYNVAVAVGLEPATFEQEFLELFPTALDASESRRLRDEGGRS